MASWRKLFIFVALLPGMAAAADPEMFQLIMPDARLVMEINLDRIVASPIGQTMSTELKGQLQSMRADWQQPLAGFSGLDWSHYAQEVVIATTGGPGKQPPSLVIVRGLLDPAWVESLNAFRGPKSSYLGVPILSNEDGSTIVAFLNGSIAVIGQPGDVKAAIRRRGQNTPPSKPLAEGLARFEGQYDTWMVSSGGLSAPAKSPAANSLKWLEHVEAFSGAMRFSPDFEISAEITMRDEKDVAEMANGLKWLLFVGQTQEGAAGSLNDMKLQAEGKHLSFALRVPEQQVLAALRQRQVGQRPLVAQAPPARPAEISNGLPAPPDGTIRVQSSPSDMGTVLLPVRKPD